VTVTGLPKEPVTVVVIMGESINPSRLSLFGAKRETTPNLTAWASKPPAGFTMIPRVGFSAGVSTRASVPSFIRTSFIPVEGEQRGINLFDLARRQGFKSWVFSAQSDRYESAAGGAVGVERLVAREGNEKTFDRVKDDYLVELVRSVSSKSPYQFFFIHQRVNHIPYLWNCAHLAGAVSRFTHGADVGPKYSEGEQRLASYDDGLRCWDRNVAALVSAFLDRPGAVQIIITADHNELMGEDGLFGHLHPVLRGAAVPFILITNRSDSAVANAFRAMSPRSFYNLTRVVATAFGADIETPHVTSSFYFNSTLPFGNAGYLEVEQVSPWHFVVASFNRDGSSNRTRSVDLSDVGSAEGFAEKLASPSGS
jgi:glucan phosphoethanolaminetransferase (alkaline phosphatase superfamily)